jgi:hypothetical protein
VVWVWAAKRHKEKKIKKRKDYTEIVEGTEFAEKRREEKRREEEPKTQAPFYGGPGATRRERLTQRSQRTQSSQRRKEEPETQVKNRTWGTRKR